MSSDKHNPLKVVYEYFVEDLAKLLKLTMLVINEETRLKELVGFLGHKFTLVYDMGDMHHINIKLLQGNLW